MRDGALGLSAGLIAMAVLLAAPAAAADVTVLRGSAAVETGSKVTALRGRTAEAAEPDDEVAATPVQIVSGRFLWVVDLDDEMVTACTLADTTDFDDREIRCFADDLFPEESLLVTD